MKSLRASHDADQIINPVSVCQLLSTDDDDDAVAQWNLYEAFGIMLISILYLAFKHVLMSEFTFYFQPNIVIILLLHRDVGVKTDCNVASAKPR